MNITTPNPEGSGNPGGATVDTKALTVAFDEITKLIDECPEEYLIELFKKHNGTDFIPEFVTADVFGSPSKLEQMALLGNKTAIEDLAALSNRIAGFLDRMAGSSDDQVQLNVDKKKFTTICGRIHRWGISPRRSMRQAAKRRLALRFSRLLAASIQTGSTHKTQPTRTLIKVGSRNGSTPPGTKPDHPQK